MIFKYNFPFDRYFEFIFHMSIKAMKKPETHTDYGQKGVMQNSGKILLQSNRIFPFVGSAKMHR